MTNERINWTTQINYIKPRKPQKYKITWKCNDTSVNAFSTKWSSLKKFEEGIFLSKDPLLLHIVCWPQYVNDMLCFRNGPPSDIPPSFRHVPQLQLLHYWVHYWRGGGDSLTNLLHQNISIETGHNVFSIHRKRSCTETFLNVPGGGCHCQTIRPGQ